MWAIKSFLLTSSFLTIMVANGSPQPKPAARAQQVWDVDRLIRARNPGAVFTTTERADVTWQTLRSITYSPTLQQGSVGSASVQEASLVRSFKGRTTAPDKSSATNSLQNKNIFIALMAFSVGRLHYLV